MRITFLGTGTSQGVPVIGCNCEACQSEDWRDQRLRCSILIEVDDINLVVDIGPDFRYQMLRNKIEKLDALYITHEHRDHVAGLDDIRPFNFKYGMDMPVYATSQVQQELKKSFNYIFEANYPGVPQVVLKDIQKDQLIKIQNVQIQPIQYFHAALPVMGLRIQNFAYLTDFKTIEADQMAHLKDLEVLVISALHHNPHYSHLSLKEALEMIEMIQPQKAYLTHISHGMGLFEATEKLLPPNVLLAYDTLQVTL